MKQGVQPRFGIWSSGLLIGVTALSALAAEPAQGFQLPPVTPSAADPFAIPDSGSKRFKGVVFKGNTAIATSELEAIGAKANEDCRIGRGAGRKQLRACYYEFLVPAGDIVGRPAAPVGIVE